MCALFAGRNQEKQKMSFCFWFLGFVRYLWDFPGPPPETPQIAHKTETHIVVFLFWGFCWACLAVCPWSWEEREREGEGEERGEGRDREERERIIGEYCSVVIVGCGVGVLQNNRTAFFEDYAGNRHRKQKAGRKRPRMLENRQKLGQIDEKNTMNPKKALPGCENGARVEFFKILGQNAKIAQRARKINEKITKICQNLPKSAKICKNQRKLAKSAKSTYRSMHVPRPNMTTP